MTVLGWTLIGLGYVYLIACVLKWLRINTRLPLPGRAQDVRALCRQQTRIDVETAVAEALRAERQSGGWT